MDSVEVKHVQQPDQDTLIEQSLTLIKQSVKMANTVIKQHFA